MIPAAASAWGPPAPRRRIARRTWIPTTWPAEANAWIRRATTTTVEAADTGAPTSSSSVSPESASTISDSHSVPTRQVGCKDTREHLPAPREVPRWRARPSLICTRPCFRRGRWWGAGAWWPGQDRAPLAPSIAPSAWVRCSRLPWLSSWPCTRRIPALLARGSCSRACATPSARSA